MTNLPVPTDPDPIIGRLSIEDLIAEMVAHRASDLHLTANTPPLIRIHGYLCPLEYPALSARATQGLTYEILDEEQIALFEREHELDMAFSIPELGRFRVNVFQQRGCVTAVIRSIPQDIPTLESLEMPVVIRELARRPRGLVLVTGPTGSGKSTTLAAMINEINNTFFYHVVTLEDPIEFVHLNKRSIINQREVGTDTQSYSRALRHILRQDPDVILIGELRDLETISAAITAAETGHLVLATLHTTSAAQTVDRMVDVFPSDQQDQIRCQLSNVLEGVITQTLLPRKDRKGRACAQEILICTPAVRNLIREGKVHQIPSMIQQSGKFGMQTLDHSLMQLVRMGRISLDDAKRRAFNPEDLVALHQ